MKKAEYLKLALINNWQENLVWLRCLLTVTRPKGVSQKPGDIISKPTGYEVVLPDSSVERLEDAQVSAPIFRFLDPVVIDESWQPNVKGVVQTVIGNLLFNAVCVVPSFGKKIEFLTGKVGMARLEAIAAARFADEPVAPAVRQDNFIYHDEWTGFVDKIQFYKSLGDIASATVTERTLLPAPGITEYKQKLLKEKYDGGKLLSDPVQAAQFDKDVTAYDDKYLEGDPTLGKFMSGKAKSTARRKLHNTVGTGVTFDSNTTTVTPVINSLTEGWPRDPEQLIAVLNDARAGSFSRGSETVKGGVAAKDLIRIFSNFTLAIADCGSASGKMRYIYDNEAINALKGVTAMQGAKSLEIIKENEAANYLGKVLKVRSPMYCLSKGDSFCMKCMGQSLEQYTEGLVIPGTEISAVILTASLKKFHTSGTVTVEMDLEQVFS